MGTEETLKDVAERSEVSCCKMCSALSCEKRRVDKEQVKVSRWCRDWCISLDKNARNSLNCQGRGSESMHLIHDDMKTVSVHADDIKASSDAKVHKCLSVSTRSREATRQSWLVSVQIRSRPASTQNC